MPLMCQEVDIKCQLWGKELKCPFPDPEPHPPFFSRKDAIFALARAFMYMCMYKIPLANSFVWKNNCQILDLLCY